MWGQTRCPVCRSGTLNVQRSTLNFQRSVRKGSCGRDMGTDTMFGRTAEQIGGQTRYLTRAAGFFTRAPRYGDRHDVRYADQERSTCNAQLSTFNEVTERVQGGRDMGTDTMFGRTAEQIEGQTRYLARAAGFFTRAPRYGDRHDVRCADQERSTSNVQLSTFNGVSERVHVGGIWGQTRYLGGRRSK